MAEIGTYTMTMHHLRLTSLVASLALAAAAMAADPTAESVRSDTKISSGLVVLVGSSDAKLAMELAKGGTVVVHVLTRDAATRDAIRTAVAAAGMSGQVTAERWTDPKRLPFPIDTVNVVVSDQDVAGAPSRDEIMRIVAPYGSAYLGSKGAWKAEVKPLPAGMDGWTHMDYGPESNPVNKDTLVGPATSVRWIGGTYNNTDAGFRLDGGLVINQYPTTTVDGTNDTIQCRDAFNGALRWIGQSKDAVQRNSLVMVNGTVYYEQDRGKPMAALDAKTGAVIREFSEGFTRPNSRAAPLVYAIVSDGVLIQVRLVDKNDPKKSEALPDGIRALDIATGKLLWQVSAPEGQYMWHPCVGNKRLHVTVAKSFGGASYLQQHIRQNLSSIHAYDLKSGTLVWSCPLEDKKINTAAMLFAEGKLLLATRPQAKLNDKDPEAGTRILAVNAADGKIAWHTRAKAGGHFENVLARDGKAWISGICEVTPVDLATGAAEALMGTQFFACSYSRGSANWWLVGGQSSLAKDGTWFAGRSKRGSCDTGAYPGYGLNYIGATNCGCFPMIMGQVAFGSDAPPAPIARPQRVEAGPALAGAVAPATWPAAGTWPIFLGSPQRSGAIDGSIGDTLSVAWTTKVAAPASKGQVAVDWNSWEMVHDLTQPTVADGLVVVAEPHRHRVIGLDAANGTIRWQHTAGGRVDLPPTIYGNRVLFGSRDGTVSAVDTQSGNLAWRFTAAPSDKRILAYSQIESSWPVTGSVMIHKGSAWVAAGRHAQTDGGIAMWQLNPATGEPIWSSSITEPVTMYKPGTGPKALRYATNLNEMINLPLNVTDNKLYMVTTLIDPAKTPDGSPIANDVPPALYWLQNEHLAPNHEGVKGWVGAIMRPTLIGYATNLWRAPRQADGWRSMNSVTYGGLKARAIATGADGVFYAAGGQDKLFPNRGGIKGEYLSAWKRDPAKIAVKLWSIPGDALSCFSLIRVGDRLVLGIRKGPKGAIAIHSTTDGKLISSIDLPSPPIASGLAWANGNLIVTCDDGSVVCLRGK